MARSEQLEADQRSTEARVGAGRDADDLRLVAVDDRLVELLADQGLVGCSSRPWERSPRPRPARSAPDSAPPRRRRCRAPRTHGSCWDPRSPGRSGRPVTPDSHTRCSSPASAHQPVSTTETRTSAPAFCRRNRRDRGGSTAVPRARSRAEARASRSDVEDVVGVATGLRRSARSGWARSTSSNVIKTSSAPSVLDGTLASTRPGGVGTSVRSSTPRKSPSRSGSRKKRSRISRSSPSRTSTWPGREEVRGICVVPRPEGSVFCRRRCDALLLQRPSDRR